MDVWCASNHLLSLQGWLTALKCLRKPVDAASADQLKPGELMNEFYARPGVLKSSPEGTWQIVEDVDPLYQKTCSGCGQLKIHYRQHRPGQKPKNRWACIPCKHRQIADLNAAQRGGYSEKGLLEMSQRTMTDEEKKFARRQRQHEIQYMLSSGYHRHMKQRYGVTYEQYKAMLKAQDGKCAAGCGFEHRPAAFFKANQGLGNGLQVGDKHHRNFLLVIDHCHDSGQVRGLLCAQCNLYLGSVEKAQKAGTLETMVNYLATA